MQADAARFEVESLFVAVAAHGQFQGSVGSTIDIALLEQGNAIDTENDVPGAQPRVRRRRAGFDGLDLERIGLEPETERRLIAAIDHIPRRGRVLMGRGGVGVDGEFDSRAARAGDVAVAATGEQTTDTPQGDARAMHGAATSSIFQIDTPCLRSTK